MKNFGIPLLVCIILATGTAAYLILSSNRDATGESGMDSAEIRESPESREIEAVLDHFPELPSGVRNSILSDTGRFMDLLAPVCDLPWELGVLVDKSNPLPEGYAPENLLTLSAYAEDVVINKTELYVSSVMIQDFLAMVRAARSHGIILDVSSAYRSEAYQRGLFERYVETHGREQAERFSARPGTSQHQLGTAIDFGSITREFENTDAGRWLFEHAWKYGFSLSYPDGYEGITGYIYEPWHYRYLGRPATVLEREYFQGVQQYMLEFLHRYQQR
jgi:zinc D-Ala-D-Ala carboxypeptidase